MFNLPDEVNQIILDYLPVDDLLNASLVSKTWFQYIAASVPFRKKIIINSTFFSNPENLKKRKYESLSIRQQKLKDEKLIKNYEWKSVYFNVQKISSQKDFVSLIKKLIHVKDLKIMNVAIRKLTAHDKLVLHKLEHLVFSDVAVDTFETFMAHQQSLKSLSLRYLTCDILNTHTAGEYVVQFLILNNQLSELELYADVIASLFKSEVTQTLSLKLRYFSLNLLNSSNDSVVRKNLQDFIMSQESSLEELKILFQQKFVGRRRQVREFHYFYYEEEHVDDDVDEECSDIPILLDVWNNLSNLKKLTLRFFVNFVESEVYPSMFKNFKPNNNIKILNIQHINCTIPWRTIAMIIQLCPNLNSLYISVLNPTVLQFCCGNLKILRNLSYCIEKENSIAAYNALINSGDDKINKFIKFHRAYNG